MVSVQSSGSLLTATDFTKNRAELFSSFWGNENSPSPGWPFFLNINLPLCKGLMSASVTHLARMNGLQQAASSDRWHAKAMTQRFTCGQCQFFTLPVQIHVLLRLWWHTLTPGIWLQSFCISKEGKVKTFVSAMVEVIRTVVTKWINLFFKCGRQT